MHDGDHVPAWALARTPYRPLGREDECQTSTRRSTLMYEAAFANVMCRGRNSATPS